MGAEEFMGMSLGLIAILSIFVILPGMILHFLTKWRSSNGLSPDDERMLEDLWRSAREMERRIETLENLVEPDQRPRRAPEDNLRPPRRDS